MSTRFDYYKACPEATEAMLKLEEFIKSSGLDAKLYELIKLRASQINGCSYCIDSHTGDLKKMGETDQRLYLLSVWREVPFYSEQECAVLALTEAVSRISEAGVPDDVYEQVMRHYDERQFMVLIMAINTINSWNRIGIATRLLPKQK
ncbi:alkylhydroperoxidase like protein, AhpD family [Paenibacillus curdlanolyticus YK9]|uniref:Alkylhydroperoxidase like protein, AhpD family n=1 Tax=Paenibacillus curdlanolyticus YK9 TaxID=717606 RepID=E0ID39_9BACL|nr:carboxymuconolactone decarboxylase family protein [Paenibacillus curdlanolyticus]EFM09494.1 alkylhydroperoxidase like protein, AhpD family [Paenibacillus curdlanolyticus YK9]